MTGCLGSVCLVYIDQVALSRALMSVCGPVCGSVLCVGAVDAPVATEAGKLGICSRIWFFFCQYSLFGCSCGAQSGDCLSCGRRR